MSDQLTELMTGHVAAGGSRPESVEMNFKDGQYRVHEAIVDHLGGVELLRQNVDMFKDKTYREFTTGFHKLVERDQLKRSFEGVIRNHLMNFNNFV